jgi:type IV secretion system protein VirD4
LTRTPGKPIEPVKFIVDEMPALGALESLKTGVSLMAGFGVQFHLIVQDFSQLRGTYGDSWESFIANCGILQVFGVRDLFTARYISDMLGQSTVAVKAMQFSTGGSPGGLTHSKGSSYSELGRPLLTTGEVLTLSPWAQIIFPPSGRPILAGKHFWYAEAPWNMRGQAEQDIFKPLPRPPAAPVAVSGGQGDVMVGVAANAAATSVAVK